MLQGELTEHAVRGRQRRAHTICRCAACGTALFSYYPRFGRLGAGIRVGHASTIPPPSRPTAVVFTASKMPWVALPEGIPAFEAYYNPKDVLSEENFARLIALIERKATGEG